MNHKLSNNHSQVVILSFFASLTTAASLAPIDTHPAEEKQGPTAAKHTPVAEVTSTEEHPLGRIFPIASLTPYQGKWTIKGRVTVKTKVSASPSFHLISLSLSLSLSLFLSLSLSLSLSLFFFFISFFLSFSLNHYVFPLPSIMFFHSHPFCFSTPIHSQVRTWNNSKGQGKLFSFNMADKSGEIKVGGFEMVILSYWGRYGVVRRQRREHSQGIHCR